MASRRTSDDPARPTARGEGFSDEVMTDAARRNAAFRRVGQVVADGRDPGRACAVALEMAFLAGVESAKPRSGTAPRGPSVAMTIEPLDLRPRCREALAAISTFCFGAAFGRSDGPHRDVVGLLGLMVSGFPAAARWHLVSADKVILRSWPEGVLSPLFGMGLLAEMPGTRGYACLSRRGRMLCRTGRTSTDVAGCPSIETVATGSLAPLRRTCRARARP